MNKAVVITSSLLTFIGMGLFVYTFFMNNLHETNKKGRDIGKIQRFKDELKDLKDFQKEDHELNPDLIDFYKKQAQTFSRESQKIKKELTKKNKVLNQFFKDIPLDSRGFPRSSSRFQSAYITVLKQLSQSYIDNCGADPELDSSGISKSLGQVSYINKWGTKTPDSKDLRPSMRQYNILEGLYTSLKDSGIHYLEKIIINTEETPIRRINPKMVVTHPLYSTIPVTLTCEIEAKKVTDLLANLLRNPQITFQVNHIQAEKTEGFNFPQNNKNLKNGLKITFNLQVLEFTENQNKS